MKLKTVASVGLLVVMVGGLALIQKTDVVRMENTSLTANVSRVELVNLKSSPLQQIQPSGTVISLQQSVYQAPLTNISPVVNSGTQVDTSVESTAIPLQTNFLQNATNTIKNLFTSENKIIPPQKIKGILMALEKPHKAPYEMTDADLQRNDTSIDSVDYKIIVHGQRPIDVILEQGELLPDSLEIGSEISLDHSKIRTTRGVSTINPNDITVVRPPSVNQNSRSAGMHSKKIAIIMVNSIDESIKYSQADIKRILLTSAGGLKEFWSRMSSGKLSISGNIAPDGDVFGPYTTTITQANCDIWQAQMDGISQAINDGFIETGYDYVMFILPEGTGCGWGGLAQIMLPLHQPNPDPVTGARYAWSFVRAFSSEAAFKDIANHELGHNLGLHHARSFECYQYPPSGAGYVKKFGDPNIDYCYDSEYGDRFDVMGSSSENQMISVTHQDWLGFLDQTDKQLFSRSGNYTIKESLSKNSSKPSLIRIPMRYTPPDPDSNFPGATTRYIELELRKTPLAGTRSGVYSSGQQHLLVRHVYYIRGLYDSQNKRLMWWYRPYPSLLNLKNAPAYGNSGGSYSGREYQILVEGESFHEPNSGLKITFSKSRSPEADLIIERDSPICTEGGVTWQMPVRSFTFSRVNIKAVFPIILTNNDTGACLPKYGNVQSYDFEDLAPKNTYNVVFPRVVIPGNTTQNHLISFESRDKSLETTPPVPVFNMYVQGSLFDVFNLSDTVSHQGLSIYNPFYNDRRENNIR